MLSTPLRFLPVEPVELCLATVLKSGQSFRWHRSDAPFATISTPRDEPASTSSSSSSSSATSDRDEGEEWAFGCTDRTVVLRQTPRGIYYRALHPWNPPHAAFTQDLKEDTTRAWIKSYFQLDTLLAPLYDSWAQRDPHFKKKLERDAERLRGIRVLNQDPWEALASFICSANNNIPRITLMVNRLCAHLGTKLPHPSRFTADTVCADSEHLPQTRIKPEAGTDDLHLYSYPEPELLISDETDPLLRELGFGYRAPYIQSTALLLLEKARQSASTPRQYLETLGDGKLEGGIAEAREKLMEFKGVGRKVADCVALFGLNHKDCVPVDTHVFQIAIRDYGFPASKSTSLTPILHDKVADRLAKQWGSHAGWAQQVLFFADLKPSTNTATEVVVDNNNAEKVKKEAVVVKAKWEQEVEALLETPTKRRRVTIKSTHEEQEPVIDRYPTPQSLPPATKSKRPVSKKRKSSS